MGDETGGGAFCVSIDLLVRQLPAYSPPAIEVPGSLPWGKVLMHLHMHGSCSPLGSQSVPKLILYHVHILPNLSPLLHILLPEAPPAPRGCSDEHQPALPLIQFVLSSEGACLVHTGSPTPGSLCTSTLSSKSLPAALHISPGHWLLEPIYPSGYFTQK